ncbi:MAG: hypothetical protein HXY40_15765 [Chloroflexi bacterium]|nr:hypothetical protein [Chloroflexota bacterium]
MMVVITSSKFVTALFQAAIRAYKNMAHYVRIVPGENEARALIVAARAQDENVINPRALPSNHPSRLAAEKS